MVFRRLERRSGRSRNRSDSENARAVSLAVPNREELDALTHQRHTHSMFLRSLVLVILLSGCLEKPRPALTRMVMEPAKLELFDGVRRRRVPITLYGAPSTGTLKPLAIISHGYGGHSTDQSFIAKALVQRGYVVASIEHLELPSDPPIAEAGNLAELRRPVWQIGADSIGYVIAELRRRKIASNKKVVLVGHSNGGDMTMLFARQHPDLVQTAFSLDNRRMPLPRTASPRICSARSNDFPADPGVLPTLQERQALNMIISSVPVGHNYMWDGAKPNQKEAMLAVLSACLDDNAR